MHVYRILFLFSYLHVSVLFDLLQGAYCYKVHKCYQSSVCYTRYIQVLMSEQNNQDIKH